MKRFGTHTLQAWDRLPRKLMHDGARARRDAPALACMAVDRQAKSCGFLIGLGMRGRGVLAQQRAKAPLARREPDLGFGDVNARIVATKLIGRLAAD